MTDQPLTQDQCVGLVSQYLAGQGWELAAPQELAAQIWQILEGSAVKPAVLELIPRLYATLLHDHALQTETYRAERAWHEIKHYLEKYAGRFSDHPQTGQEIVQETLIALRQALPLQKPASLLVFAIQTMRRRSIDRHRRRTAEKRGEQKTISLEELNRAEEDNSQWEEYLSPSAAIWRTIETIVADQEVRQRLLQFAGKHLPTGLQQMVFEAHFLDGLSPAETARLLGKQPHEIRLVKSRIVTKIKSLPRPEFEQLLAILGETDADA